MAFGPGKYDDLATEARKAVDARAVLLLIVDGTRGSGFSLQATFPGLSPHVIVEMLRSVATQIEIDAGAG